MNKGFQPASLSDLLKMAVRAPIGVKITFSVVFVAIFAWFELGLVDDYKQHMLVRDHGTDQIATVTKKIISHGSRHNSYYFDYSFVPREISPQLSSIASGEAPKRFLRDSEDVRPSVFDSYDVGSKIRVRYATSEPNISFLHIDDCLETKCFQTGEIIDTPIFALGSLMAAVFLTFVIWLPRTIWFRAMEIKERNLRYEREAIERLTKYEPDTRQSRPS